MKKAISIIVCLCIVLSAVSVVSFALSTEDNTVVSTGYYDSTEMYTEPPTETEVYHPDGVWWSMDGSVLTIHGNGKMEDYDTYDHRDYDEHYYYQAPWVKYHKDEIETVIIEKGVTSISRYAFYGCSNITSVTIPDTVTWIGRNAFSGCEKISRVNISSIAAWCNIDFSFTVYNDDYSDDNDRYATGTNPLEYAHNLYLNDELVTDLEIPDGVTDIGTYAFYECIGLTNVTVPASLRYVGKGAFYGCTGLTGIHISNLAAWCEIRFQRAYYYYEDYGHYSGGTNPLEYAHNLYLNNELITEVVVPDSITYINADLFHGCSSIKSVVLNQAGVKRFKAAFNGCDGIETVILKDGVTSIKGRDEWTTAYDLSGFSEDKRIKSIIISASVKEIDIKAFRGCTNLSTITVDPNNRLFDSRDNSNAIIDTRTNTLILGCKDTVIPNTVTSIGNSAFAGCSGLTSIVFPDTVTSIGDSAFEGCTALTRVDFPDSVTSIGSSAFADCTALTSVDVHAYIGEFAFKGCKGLTNAIINGSIGDGAFGCCTNLTTVSLGSSVRSIGDGAFCGCNGLSSITVPASVTSIGKEALGYYAEYIDYWGDFGNVKKIEDFTIYGYNNSQAYDYAWYDYIDFFALSNLLGDADGNGELDVTDGTYIQRYLVDIPIPYTKEQLMSGDVDGSGDLELTDVTAIQYHLVHTKNPYKIGEPII